MQPGDRAVFRMPGISVLVPIALLFFTVPLASASVWTVGLFALPLLTFGYVIWTKTTADAHRITVDTWTGRRHILWADLDGLEFNGPRWAVAVAVDGRRYRLPMVRPRDLPRLAAVSGGRLYLGESAVDDAEAASNFGTATIDTVTIDGTTETVDAGPTDTLQPMLDPRSMDSAAVTPSDSATGPAKAAHRPE